MTMHKAKGIVGKNKKEGKEIDGKRTYTKGKIEHNINNAKKDPHHTTTVAANSLSSPPQFITKTNNKKL